MYYNVSITTVPLIKLKSLYNFENAFFFSKNQTKLYVKIILSYLCFGINKMFLKLFIYVQHGFCYYLF